MLRWEEEKQGKINTDRSQRVRQFCPPSSLSLTHHSGTVYPVPTGAQGPSHREAKDPTRQDIFLHLCCLLSSATTARHHTIPTAPLHGSPFFSTLCVYSLPGRRWSAPPSLSLCWKPAAAMTKHSYRCKNSACVQLNLITSSYLSANPHRILTRAFKRAAAVVNATSFFQVPSGETPPNSSPDSSDVAQHFPATAVRSHVALLCEKMPCSSPRGKLLIPASPTAGLAQPSGSPNLTAHSTALCK